MLYGFDGHAPVIGAGTYVSETAIVIGNVTIGDNCYIGHGSILRGDYGRIEIGSETAVEEGAIIHAPPNSICKIGKRVTIGHGAIIHAEDVGDWAVLGMGSILSLESKIGAGAIIAEGTVVKWSQVIPEKVVAAGNPARVVRGIAEKDLAMWSRGKQLYVDLAAKYLKNGIQTIPERADAGTQSG